MAYNIPLKTAVLKTRKRQIDIAKAAGISETIFSQIVTGRIVPTKDEKRAIARVLRCGIQELWPPSSADDTQVA